MQKSRIEWTNYTWNPIKGLCPVGCWYCYARRMYKRFGWPQDLFLDGRVPILSNKKPSKIFICSTVEIFHPYAPKRWRDFIFNTIESFPQHTFQILTKMPQNIDRPMPDNVWLGVSVTGENERIDFNRIKNLQDSKAKIKFISYEPLLGQPVLGVSNINWIIIGRLTGFGHKYDSDRELIEGIIGLMRQENIPIFLKDNLKEIWGEDFIQEFPE